jgi:hypothetical protein
MSLHLQAQDLEHWGLGHDSRAKERGRFRILDDGNKLNALRYDDISTNRWCDDTVACAVNASNR